ncbi:putative chromatin regulator PHD family [Medicago truncatula]|nr:putative chromatin regulator PHD family [Medicago truncatula]
MVDRQVVCCMCGDVGFTHKLFRCNKCHHRFQHSYCTNFYGELSEIEQCDWCQSEMKNTVASNNSKKPAVAVTINRSSSGCSGGSEKRKSSPVPSPRRR